MSLRLKILIWILVGVCLLFSVFLPLDYDPERSLFDNLLGSGKEKKQQTYTKKQMTHMQQVVQIFH